MNLDERAAEAEYERALWRDMPDRGSAYESNVFDLLYSGLAYCVGRKAY